MIIYIPKGGQNVDGSRSAINITIVARIGPIGVPNIWR